MLDRTLEAVAADSYNEIFLDSIVSVTVYLFPIYYSRCSQKKNYFVQFELLQFSPLFALETVQLEILQSLSIFISLLTHQGVLYIWRYFQNVASRTIKNQNLQNWSVQKFTNADITIVILYVHEFLLPKRVFFIHNLKAFTTKNEVRLTRENSGDTTENILHIERIYLAKVFHSCTACERWFGCVD